ncbi:MAG: hypothetical protein RLZZ352_2707 [Pseudomonadota bacterium]|jgi:hypothetical protein
MENRYANAFDACLAEALVHMREWVPQWLSKLHEALLQRELDAVHINEKLQFVQARKQLENQRDLIAMRFIEAFANSLQTTSLSDGVHARSLRSISFEELELMGDQQVQETVEVGRVLQQVKMTADEALFALNGRMSSIQGLNRIRAEANPLRPEAIVSVLMQTLNALTVDADVRKRWLQVGAAPLGQVLSHAYIRLSTMLEGYGIEPTAFHVIQAPVSRMVLGAASSNMAGQASAASRADAAAVSLLNSDALLTLGHLHQLLVGNLQSPTDATDNPDAVRMSTNMVRTLAAEVVGLMMRSIEDDQRLLPGLRRLIAGMKPALIELANSNPRFFAERDNPARLLLEKVTERCLAFTTEQSPGYADFQDDLRTIVQTLQRPGPPDVAARFPELLQTLSRSPKNTLPPAQVQARGLAVQTLVRVEQRNLLAQRVLTEMTARNDFGPAPEFVKDFLRGPWCQVVAQARMDGAEQAGNSGQLLPPDAPAVRYMALLPDLIWSAQPALACRNRQRLMKVIPGLLSTLREGLQGIDCPSEQTDTFFQRLMKAHMAANKVPRTQSPVEPPAPPRVFKVEPEPWVQPEEARITGFLEDFLSDTAIGATPSPDLADTSEVPTEVLSKRPFVRDWAEIKQEIVQQESAALPVGTWVDVWQGVMPMRCQITWASPHGTLFMLTAVDGHSISLTRRSLDSLRAQNRLRVVAPNGVVNTALDAVTQQAWINSSKQQGNKS